MAFRIYLQPAMSTVYAIIGGLKDAREHKPPYFWAMFTEPSHRAELLQDGWKSVRNVFLLAIGMDLIYQVTVLKGLKPVEGLIGLGRARAPAVPDRSWPGEPAGAALRQGHSGRGSAPPELSPCCRPRYLAEPPRQRGEDVRNIPFGDALALARDLERHCVMRIPGLQSSRTRSLTMVAAAVVLAVACGPGEPRTDAERLSRARKRSSNG